MVDQYFRELRKTPRMRETFGTIKSPEELPPNKRLGGHTPNNESKEDIS